MEKTVKVRTLFVPIHVEETAAVLTGLQLGVASLSLIATSVVTLQSEDSKSSHLNSDEGSERKETYVP